MFRTIYFIILVYFLLGGLGFYFISKKKESREARKNWIKFITYFLIVTILFFSIVINPLVFRYIVVLIIIIGFFELYKVFRESRYI
jgi:phosphatidate cytidylyltransferase